MPIIAHRDKRKKVNINEDILENVHDRIIQYCEWAGITDMGYFIEEAASYIFANDRLWQEFLAKSKATS